MRGFARCRPSTGWWRRRWRARSSSRWSVLAAAREVLEETRTALVAGAAEAETALEPLCARGPSSAPAGSRRRFPAGC